MEQGVSLATGEGVGIGRMLEEFTSCTIIPVIMELW
jgi:hypothetical protein